MKFNFFDNHGVCRLFGEAKDVNDFAETIKFYDSGTIMWNDEDTIFVFDYTASNGAEFNSVKRIKDFYADYVKSKKERESEKEIEALKNQVAELAHAVLVLSRNKKEEYKDLQLTKRAFAEVVRASDLLAAATKGDEDDAYDHDVTLHWHGLYTNFYDGALVYNEILDPCFIESFTNEEEWSFAEKFNEETCKVELDY